MRKLLLYFTLMSTSLVYAQESAKSFKVAERTFEVPESWTAETPSSRMRKAQFKNGKVEIVVFFFGAGSGGSAEANVNRWIGQFKEPKEELSAKVEKKKIKTATITTVSARGTYMSGSPFGQKTPMPNYAMRGAIIECKGGPIFIKMTGPMMMLLNQYQTSKKQLNQGFDSESELNVSSVTFLDLFERELNIFRMSLSPPIET